MASFASCPEVPKGGGGGPRGRAERKAAGRGAAPRRGKENLPPEFRVLLVAGQAEVGEDLVHFGVLFLELLHPRFAGGVVGRRVHVLDGLDIFGVLDDFFGNGREPVEDFLGRALGSRDACPAVIVALIALLRESGSGGVYVALGADGEDLELVGGSHGRWPLRRRSCIRPASPERRCR